MEGAVLSESLSHAEARQLTDEAREHANTLWRMLLRLHEGGAHTALGYPSWEAFFNTEFRRAAPGQRIDPKHPYRLLRAARVEAEVSTYVSTEGMREAHARVMVTMQPDERVKVARWVADARLGWDNVSARELRDAREQVRGNLAVVSNPATSSSATDETRPLQITAWNRTLADEMHQSLAYLDSALALLREGRPARMRHFVLPEALRALPQRDATAVRERITQERSRVKALAAALREVGDRLDLAAHVLDQREDIPRSDAPQGVQVTVQEMAAIAKPAAA